MFSFHFNFTFSSHFFLLVSNKKMNGKYCSIKFFDGLDVVDISVSFKRSDGIKKAGKL